MAFYYEKLHHACLTHGINRVSWVMPEKEARLLCKATFPGEPPTVGRLIEILAGHITSPSRQPKLFTKEIDKTVRKKFRGRRYFVPVQLASEAEDA